MKRALVLSVASLASTLLGCARPSQPTRGHSSASSSPAHPTLAPIAPIAEATATHEVVDPSPEAKPTYPWLDDATLSFPAAVDSLDARFSPPPGFSRVKLDRESFGDFTRHLPLAADGTPVVTYTGALLHAATDPRIAAVVALDVGTHDTQQCADSVIRLHAEWRWSLGRRDESYRSASGAELPFARFVAGERVVASGMSIAWKKLAPASAPTHAVFRDYLETVFGWASTRSLAKEGSAVDVADLSPGDFVIAPGNPGHAVLVLDLAQSPDGRRVALLGQGYMPAQSFQVLRAASGSPWFAIDPTTSLDTPFWEPFPWKALRRLGA